MFKAAFIKKYVKQDMYHGVCKAYALQRAELTHRYNAMQISAKEYHRQMDIVDALYPEDRQKIQESGGRT